MRNSHPLAVALILQAFLAVSAIVQPVGHSASLPVAAVAAGPVDGQLYFMAGASASGALYRLDLTARLSIQEALSASTGQDADGVRLYPSPSRSQAISNTQPAYLAVLQPVLNRPAPQIRMIDTVSGQDASWQSALGSLSPLGQFAGWHPDGRHVLYNDGYDRSGLWLLDLGGSQAPLRLSAGVTDAAAYSPDGSVLAFAGRGLTGGPGYADGLGASLWLANADGSQARVVLELPGETSLFGLSWSPDGSRLAYVVGGAELWTIGRDGSDPRRLASDYASGWGFAPPAWSPDGTRLAFNALVVPVGSAEADAYGEAGAFRHVTIHVVDLATATERPLLSAERLATGNLHPAWSPDGEWVAFVSDRTGDRQIWLSRSDGSAPQQMTTDPGWHSAPAWIASPQPAGMSAPLASPTPFVAPTPVPAAAGPPPMRPDPAPDDGFPPANLHSVALAPFLTTPYYGTRTITSYFDHRYPTYSTAPNSSYDRVVRYDGSDLPDCGKVAPGTQCTWYDGHDGIDFGLYYEPVRAAAGGQVTWAGWQDPNCQNGPSCGYGLWVAIDHGNGYSTRYGHLTAIAVSKGQQVRQGQVIGNSGNTGSSSGPHLHFSVHLAGRAVDPFGWSGAMPDPWADYSRVASVPLWAGGQWTGHPVAAPQTEATVIVDDGDPGYTDGCQAQACSDWQAVAGVGANGDMRWTTVKPVANNWAQWAPTLAPGMYDVYAYVPGANGTSRQAVVTFTVPSGSQRALVDQYTLANRWIALGEYEVFAGMTPQARITDATGETDTTRQIAVDAVRFVRRKPLYPYRTLLVSALRRWPPLPDIPILSPIDAPGARGSYTVTWNAAYLATSYVLQEAANPDFTNSIQVYAGSGTSFVVNSRGAQNYYYRVRAHNQLGDSAWSGAQAVDVSWENEPNNTQAQANGPLEPDTDYYGYPLDASDYFRVDVPLTGTLGVTLTGHTGGGVQLSLYDAAGLRLSRDLAAPYHLDLSVRPGRYFIYIYTAWGYNKATSYSLRVSFPVGDRPPADPAILGRVYDQGPGADGAGEGEPAAD